jgi:hypothetical protein
MQVGTLFTRVIPQARNRGFMLVAGFDSDVNQKTMVRYITLADITSMALHKAEQEIAKMLGAKEVQDVTKDDIRKKLNRIFERQQWSYRMR